MSLKGHDILRSLALPIGLVALTSACTNAPNYYNLLQNMTTTASPTPESTTSADYPTYKIVNVGVSAGSDGKYVASLNFDSSQGIPVSNSCSSSGTNSKGCSCTFAWNQKNDSGNSSVPISRSVVTAVTNVNPYVITCPAPSVYNTEIPEGTVINVGLVSSGATSTTSNFIVKTFPFKKVTATGSFQDLSGAYFDNIYRYSCYSISSRGMDVTNAYMEQQDDSGSFEKKKIYLASKFCITKKSGGSASSGTVVCPTPAPSPQISAQSYYYNLFIPDSRKGDINLSNPGFVCPKIKETLLSDGTAGKYNGLYPMDKTFALAVKKTADFTKGVEAYSVIGIGGSDTNSVPTSCDQSGDSEAGAAVSNGLVKKCLGYAAKSNADGSCPVIFDQSGHRIQTYRLRRFISIYPPVFDSDGKMQPEGQAADTIYVLDRPVTSSDPLKPYSMFGPKPCPFSYYDHRGVAQGAAASDPAANQSLHSIYATLNAANSGVIGMPRYMPTNHSFWSGKNVDGIQLPNKDSENSCAAALPIYDDRLKMWGIGTVHSSNVGTPQMNPSMNLKNVYIRPTKPWAPHYEEDKEFIACAPPAIPAVDPPLHFAKNPVTGNIGWCAEVYPTQNPNISDIDHVNKSASNPKPYLGWVVPYTSHVAKNSKSQACTYTPIDLPSAPTYPNAEAGACPQFFGGLGKYLQGAARHPSGLIVDLTYQREGDNGCGTGWSIGGNGLCYSCAKNTCDRTVQTFSGSARFPLLAQPTQVEAALISDKSYGCLVSWDGGGAKTNKTSPSEGCCAQNVYMQTGKGTSGTSILNNFAAHLEPDFPCVQPKY